jgi:uncharacterized repeat protein (TIGR01451 family)
MTRLCPVFLGVGVVCLLAGTVSGQNESKPIASAAGPITEAQRKLVEQLGDDKFEVRAEAEHRLVDMGVAALPAVVGATGNEDPEIHRRAWHIVDRWAEKGEMPAILALLQQQISPEFRLRAIDRLAQLGPEAKSSVPALSVLLQDDSEFIRRMARDALAKIQPMPAVRVEISDSCDPIAVGDEAVYDIQVTNDGTATATDLRVVALLPRQLTVTQVQAPASNEIKGQRIRFEPIALDPQTSLRYRVHAKALRPGDVRLRVQLTMNEMATPVRAEEGTTISAPPEPSKPMP